MENKKKRLLWMLAVCAAAVLLVAAVCLIIRYYPQISLIKGRNSRVAAARSSCSGLRWRFGTITRSTAGGNRA